MGAQDEIGYNIINPDVGTFLFSNHFE